MRTFLEFETAGTRFAVSRSALARIDPVARLVVPPMTPRSIAGFYEDGRGSIAVLRCDVLFGLPRDREVGLYDHIMVLGGDGPRTGLLVDQVVRVFEVEEKELNQVPADCSFRDFAEAVVQSEDGEALTLVSVDRLLSASERERANCFYEEERLRLVALDEAV